MKKTAFVMRIITVAPFIAFMTVSLIYLFAYDTVSGLSHYLNFIISYTVFPLLAYPVSYLIPKLKAKGRKFQRKLAIVFSVAGYLAAFIFLSVSGGSHNEWMICLSYLLSGIIIALLSFVFKFKASGHACGVSGPIAMLIYIFGPVWIIGYLLLGAVFWCSLKTKRHTLPELIAGSLITPIIILLLHFILP